jgi:intein/homing endonuclease
VHDGVIDPLHPFLYSPMLELSYTINGQERTIYSTSTHRYFDPNTSQFKEIRFFNVGDNLVSPEGNAIITGLTMLPDAVETVYNLDVEDHDNYIVNGILVANTK